MDSWSWQMVEKVDETVLGVFRTLVIIPTMCLFSRFLDSTETPCFRGFSFQQVTTAVLSLVVPCGSEPVAWNRPGGLESAEPACWST